MPKKALVLLVSILVSVFFAILFQYFSYWGISFGIILLAIIAAVIILLILLSAIIRYRKQISIVILSIGRWIASMRIWKWFEGFLRRRFPILFRLLHDQLLKTNALRLIWAVGLFITGFFIFQFLGIIVDVLFVHPFAQADLPILYLLHTVTAEDESGLFRFLTTLGGLQTIGMMFLAACAYLFIQRRYHTIRNFSLTAGGSFLLFEMLKVLIARPRPLGVNIIALPSSFSMPSGHAVMGTAVYGFIAYLIVKALQNTKQKIAVIIAFTALIFGIGLSRVYLGVHYSTDVLAGWYLGLAVLSFGITLCEVDDHLHERMTRPRTMPPLLKSFLALIAGALIALVIMVSYRHTPIVSNLPSHEPVADLSNFADKTTKYSENLFGEPMEPFSFIVIGNAAELENAFHAAGWYTAQRPTLGYVLTQISAITKNVSDQSAPMTPAFYEARPNDFGFEKETDSNSARQRHHTRYWKTGYTLEGRDIWIATASLDQSIGIGSSIKLPTHKINPDIDTERGFIFDDLLATGAVEHTTIIQLVPPTHGRNAAGDAFITDGKTYVLWLQNVNKS